MLALAYRLFVKNFRVHSTKRSPKTFFFLNSCFIGEFLKSYLLGELRSKTSSRAMHSRLYKSLCSLNFSAF